MHCALEDAGWLTKDQSCAQAPVGTHDQRDGCQFETFGVQFQAVKPTIPAIDLYAFSAVIQAPQLEPCFALIQETSELVQRIRAWQFTYRAALPPRAPSLLS